MSQQSRRRFLASSAVAAGSLGVAAASAQAAEGKDSRQYYEWRIYHLDQPTQQKRVLEYLRTAAVPAWGRLGLGPVGVFTETGDKAALDVHVLLTANSAEQLLGERVGLEQDNVYLEAAANYLNTPKGDPTFARIESSLMIAFAGQPQLQVPQRGSRMLELRIYQSYNEAKARRKIEMFNDGEIPIFRKAGFETVFFGESMIGSELPNLKYLLSANDMEANRAGWKAFINHPDWIAMKDLPKYADTVSHIDKVFLVPTDFSGV